MKNHNPNLEGKKGFKYFSAYLSSNPLNLLKSARILLVANPYVIPLPPWPVFRKTLLYFFNGPTRGISSGVQGLKPHHSLKDSL